MADTSPQQRLRVIVVGAGWNGIAAARTYLEVNPSIDLTVIDANSSIGGSWCTRRIYPGLIADSHSGLFEYTDFSMKEEQGIPAWEDISGVHVNEYLQRYAQKNGILEKCMFDTKVVEVHRGNPGWDVWVEPTGPSTKRDSKRTVMKCDKLIIAAGLTSIPSIPTLDTSKFKGPVFHSIDMGVSHQLLAADNVHEVTIVGGNKSSVEAVKYCFRAGKRVTWLIRDDGHGPGLMGNARNPKGVPISKIIYSRYTSIFRIGIYQSKGFWYQLLASGRSKWGLNILKGFWKERTKHVFEQYTKSDNGRKLKPETDTLFWNTSGTSLLHDDDADIMPTVDEGKLIHVVRSRIESVDASTIKLTNGETIKSDAIFFATGWQTGHRFLFGPQEAAELGLPRPENQLPEDEATYWREVDAKAHDYVLKTFPILKDPPPHAHMKDMTETPYRLFRGMAPTTLAAQHDRSIIFVGLLANANVPVYAEVASLWAVAYLEDKLPDGSCGGLLGDKQKMDYDVAKALAFSRRKYPRKRYVPNASLEIQDWIDIMLKDLGVRHDRRAKNAGWAWFGLKAFYAEWMQPYISEDYRGIREEAKANWAKADKKKKRKSTRPAQPAS